MQTFARRLRQPGRWTLLRRNASSRAKPLTLREAGIDSLASYKPVYEHTPPWWARWTYFVVGADLIITFVSCPLITSDQPTD